MGSGDSTPFSPPASASSAALKASASSLSDDQLAKISRQLDYHIKNGERDVEGIAKGLIEAAVRVRTEWKCPTKRFGKTNLQMPIVTIGGMRLQQVRLLMRSTAICFQSALL